MEHDSYVQVQLYYVGFYDKRFLGLFKVIIQHVLILINFY